MTDDQKERHKEKARLPMQAYRKRQKEQGSSPKTKVKTRAGKDAQRAKWRDAKRKQEKRNDFSKEKKNQRET